MKNNEKLEIIYEGMFDRIKARAKGVGGYTRAVGDSIMGRDTTSSKKAYDNAKLQSILHTFEKDLSILFNPGSVSSLVSHLKSYLTKEMADEITAQPNISTWKPQADATEEPQADDTGDTEDTADVPNTNTPPAHPVSPTVRKKQILKQQKIDKAIAPVDRTLRPRELTRINKIILNGPQRRKQAISNIVKSKVGKPISPIQKFKYKELRRLSPYMESFDHEETYNRLLETPVL